MIAEKERSRKELARLGKHIIDGMLIQIFHPQSATATLTTTLTTTRQL